ncbi:hypothetical protein [Cellulomonas fengjieae]|uniref:Uncharacterized protein n=1 Tax=Cellulomonas fengjieae TaxID=2819978 RepID=A0ABS3SH02_9CELL|nr:hypothetical protein [Cellulomonas fengjieae]MBO3085012.1 hypothetical protein [Cellulomonas fengjieae]QVI66391.1 hypothetical protein KG102_01930 [Cellulomonas fengjieae]
MTQSSEARTEALPVVVGALTHRLPARPAGNHPVRVRVRVPLDVLEATSAGLRGLDDKRRSEAAENPPSPPSQGG